MFTKIKETLLKKAFQYAFGRYDSDGSSFLNRQELTSLLNDTFQLIGYPHQVSWIEAKLAMKMFDTNSDDKISKDQAYKVVKTLLTNAGSIIGGFGGQDSGKVGGALPPEEDQCQQIKINGGVAYQPPQNLDENELEEKLNSLPPKGKNLAEEDKKKIQEEGQQAAFIM